jgi:glycerol-3-phosphate acyltransferase PlsY
MNASIPTVLIWIGFGFLSGSLPFSVWISRGLGGRDARQVGDHNPGAANALKVGGPIVGLAVFILDVSKAAFPVGLTHFVWGWNDWAILPVAVAPLLGSAFSPFLGFKGGKSLSVSLGIWIGLTLWRAPLVILVSLTAAFLVQSNSGWAVVAAILATGFFLFLSTGEAVSWAVLGFQAPLLLWKHRFDLRQPPRVRAWLAFHR